MQKLGSIDSTDVFFCEISRAARKGCDLSSAGSVSCLVYATNKCDDIVDHTLRTVIDCGALYLVFAGPFARQYEDHSDRWVVTSEIEKRQRYTVSTYAFDDFEEALNVAIHVDEKAIVVFADDLDSVLSLLKDFGMVDANGGQR